jgi:hypothetical protein
VDLVSAVNQGDLTQGRALQHELSHRSMRKFRRSPGISHWDDGSTPKLVLRTKNSKDLGIEALITKLSDPGSGSDYEWVG